MGLGIKYYQSTEKDVDKATPETYRSIIRNIWPIILLSVLCNVVTWEQGDISPAFWRSSIHCSIPQPVDGACPTGAYLSASRTACLPVSRHDPGWSGSRRCMDRDFVIRTATARSGSIGPYIGIVGIIGATFFGMSLIDRVSKKWCMVFALTTGCLVIVMHFILTWWGFTPAAIRTLCIVQCVAALTNVYNLAGNAMIAERVRNDEASRGMAFSVSSVAFNASTLLAFAIGYIVLRQNLDEYRGFYTIAMVVSVSLPMLATVLLPHSRAALHGAAEKAGLMPAVDAAVDLEGEKENDGPDGKSSFTDWCGCRTMVNTFVLPIRFILSDTWLTMMLAFGFIDSMVASSIMSILSSFGMRVVGFSQATVSLGGIIQPACTLLGSLVCSHLMAKNVNIYVLYYFSCFQGAVGMFVLSLCGAFPRQGAWLFWLGLCIAGTAGGVSVPALSVACVTRMDPRYFGGLFAIQGFFAGFGGILGGYLSTNVITPHTSPHGWSSATVIWGGAAISVTSAAIKVIVHVFK
eukprot:CAMPEP_0180496240 /NCGR_PEP_ID=MMETSP1036_2-20121128/42176_1 /TAXON_ID=632150 /ORGANISM="Azadinium spinosum, Strain 3D9" /LENGTH=519 /DNA_ID=CAMNT_0022504753 /DNA_START=66 /DNA_END=1622 /DNA_ORIENTATION=-